MGDGAFLCYLLDIAVAPDPTEAPGWVPGIVDRLLDQIAAFLGCPASSIPPFRSTSRRRCGIPALLQAMGCAVGNGASEGPGLLMPKRPI